MDYNNLSKKDLIVMIERIQDILNGELPAKQNLFSDLSLGQQSELENLIGTIPSLMQNKHIFERNQDIADFAKRLGIDIPSPEKKKKEDIIGRIIFAIANFDKRKISDLNIAIKALKKSDIKKGKNNFFKDWENAIQQMKL